MAPHEKAVRNWIAKNRPDLPKSSVDGMFENQALSFIVSMAFESGRDFQRANPTAEPRVLIHPLEHYNFDF